ncbi:putative mitochondrial adenine nucleotide transporter BTL1 [Hibiscus syriacus]|uniref:Mitochondrial adenine nucleotide transporter BTL1 n=1 Tax=Hibiscus syriacus TaxID=106335 RepID=A0A6A3A8W9_HIBSY|nr:putative mitochondrial adenine nucleotide transporter BTL1 [Hibiscus syriacus]
MISGYLQFIEFISGCKLIDLPLRRGKFTWFSLGNKRSRLDGFLIDEQWFVEIENVVQLGLKKDRLTVSPDIYPSLSISISKIYKDGGVGALYAGLSPTLMGMLPYSTCYYFMYDELKKSYCQSKKKKSLNRPEMVVLGALAGFIASTISFPLEVARKRLMVGALQGKCPPNMVAALAEVIRDEDLTGLYRGWGAV